MNELNSTVFHLFLTFVSVFSVFLSLYLFSNKNKSLEEKIKSYVYSHKLINSLNKIEKNKSKLSPSFYYNIKILALSKSSKFNEAYEVCLEALKTNISSYELFNNISYVYLNLGLYDNVITLCNRALSINSNDIYAICNKGFSYFKKQDYELAEKCFDSALSINPNFSSALSGKSQCTYNKNDFAQTAYFLEKLLTKNKSQYIIYRKLGECYFLLDKFEQSAAMYKKALKLNPTSSLCHCEYGNVLIYLSKFKASNNQLNLALELDPYNFIALYNKARLCALTHNITESFYFLDKAIQYAPALKKLALEDVCLNNLKIYSRFKSLVEL